MVHPTDVLPGGSPKHRALAYRSHRPCCPTPSAPFGCPTRRSQSLEPAALPDVSLPAIAVRPLINTASGTVRLGSMSVSGQTRRHAREILRIGYLDEAAPAEFLDARVEELARIIASKRTDRDAQHEVRSTRSRATSSTKPPPTAAPREPARRQSAGRWRRPCREATAAVLRHGSPFRDHSCVCPAPGIGTQAAAARPTGLPIRILHLSPAAHLYLSPDDAVSRISASRSRAFGDWIVERESVCK